MMTLITAFVLVVFAFHALPLILKAYFVLRRWGIIESSEMQTVTETQEDVGAVELYGRADEAKHIVERFSDLLNRDQPIRDANSLPWLKAEVRIAFYDYINSLEREIAQNPGDVESKKTLESVKRAMVHISDFVEVEAGDAEFVRRINASPVGPHSLDEMRVISKYRRT